MSASPAPTAIHPDSPSSRSAYEIGTIRLRPERVTQGVAAAGAGLAPVLACACVWMHNAALERAAGNCCVQAVTVLHYALAALGIDSRPEPVRVALTGNGTSTLYGPAVPHWAPDGEFDGHAILVVPDAGLFVDVTLQQYPEVPHSEHGELPVIAGLPGGRSLGAVPFRITRGDHRVAYMPVPGRHDHEWWDEGIKDLRDGFRNLGINLAGLVFDLLRAPEIRDRHLAGPYPRLRHLLRVLDDAPAEVRDGTIYFRRPGAPAVRLSEVL